MLHVFLKFLFTKLRKFIACCLSRMSKVGIFLQKLLVIRNSGNSFRYAVFGILMGLFLFMYVIPTLLRWNRWFHSGYIASCGDGELFAYENEIRSNDAVYAHSPNKIEEYNVPLLVTGNGFILVSMQTGQIYIKHHRTLSVPTNSPVLYKAELIGSEFSKTENIVMAHVAQGYVQNIVCHIGLDHPVTILDKVYAHRSIPSLLVQEITVKNPSSHSLRVRFSASQRSIATHDSYVTSSNLNDKSKRYFTQRVVLDVPEKKNTTYLHVLQTGVPESGEVVVQPHKTENFVVLTLANYTHFEDSLTALTSNAEKQLSLENQKLLTTLLGSIDAKDANRLFRQHAEVTEKMYRTGFGISHSKAPNAVNGDRINLTLSYVAAHYSSELLLESKEKTSAEKAMFDADKCYDDHHTLQNSRLWDMPKTLEEYFDFVRRWAITLEKHGCKDLVAAGAEGVITSMVLSFGGLHFTSHHLEFTIHPSELHRDLMHFRGLPYGSNVHLNISVEMGSDNKAQLFVSVDQLGTAYYACDAGCLDAPFRLKQTPVKIPVKLTRPVMPILYITSDREHIEELKDALHFSDIREAPPHEDDVIALHKHGHQFGGLPTVFWVTIILLIVIFHLFLIKLIVTEYYKADSKYSPPPASYSRMQRFAA